MGQTNTRKAWGVSNVSVFVGGYSDTFLLRKFNDIYIYILHNSSIKAKLKGNGKSITSLGASSHRHGNERIYFLRVLLLLLFLFPVYFLATWHVGS